jgi:hypothetical protein
VEDQRIGLPRTHGPPNASLEGVDDRADDLDDRVLVWVGFELRLKRGAVGVAEIGVDVDLADPDPGGLLEGWPR